MATRWGAGFLVTGRRVLTCAHVVRWSDRAAVTVSFPHARELGELSATVVVHGGWAGEVTDPGDVAVLELDRDVPLAPAGFAPPAAAYTEPYPKLIAYGFPRGVRRGHARRVPGRLRSADRRRVAGAGGVERARAAARGRVQRGGGHAAGRQGGRHDHRGLGRAGRAQGPDAAAGRDGPLLARAARAGARPRPPGRHPRPAARPAAPGRRRHRPGVRPEPAVRGRGRRLRAAAAAGRLQLAVGRRGLCAGRGPGPGGGGPVRRPAPRTAPRGTGVIVPRARGGPRRGDPGGPGLVPGRRGDRPQRCRARPGDRGGVRVPRRPASAGGRPPAAAERGAGLRAEPHRRGRGPPRAGRRRGW